MKCSKYPDRDAAGVCAYSGKPYCSEELVEVEGKMYAKDNLGHVFAEMKGRAGGSNPMVFMNAGGGGGAAATATTAAPVVTTPVGTKSRAVAVVLALFLGGFGAHKFYLGQIGWGILYLLFCWTPIPWVVAIFEGLNYLLMGSANFARRYG